MYRSEGIVVYKISGKCKAFLLDHGMGMQEVVFAPGIHVSIGSLVSYTSVVKRGVCFVESFALEQTPLMIAKEDIFFLHYVCEIIYSFMPLGKVITGIFEQFLFLYQEQIFARLRSKEWKQIFIGRILLWLSVYTESQQECVAFLQEIAHVPIDMIDVDSLDLAFKKSLESWVQELFEIHQRLHEPKTIPCINRYRNI